MPAYCVLLDPEQIVADMHDAYARARLDQTAYGCFMMGMKVPKNFVRVAFHSYPARSGYAAGQAAPIAALNCILRSGHTVEDKTDLLKQLWSSSRS